MYWGMGFGASKISCKNANRTNITEKVEANKIAFSEISLFH